MYSPFFLVFVHRSQRTTDFRILPRFVIILFRIVFSCPFCRSEASSFQNSFLLSQQFFLSHLSFYDKIPQHFFVESKKDERFTRLRCFQCDFFFHKNVIFYVPDSCLRFVRLQRKASWHAFNSCLRMWMVDQNIKKKLQFSVPRKVCIF